MTTQKRYEGVIAWFSEHMPAAESELHYENPFQLLVAVVLSAQCTDKRVNMTTPALFAAFPTPQAMAQASAEEIFPYIRSISYPNNKARHLASMARMLCEEFGGEVPTDLEQLQRLPGVGRKTANVLGAVLWQREVMPVDTHVFRVAERIGLTTRSKTPLQTELRLEKGFPSHLLPIAHHWLILHGRYVLHKSCDCHLFSPRCFVCAGVLAEFPVPRPARFDLQQRETGIFRVLQDQLRQLFLARPAAGVHAEDPPIGAVMRLKQP